MLPLKKAITYLIYLLLLAPCLTLSAQAETKGPGTENFTDSNGMRQGFWRITGAMSEEVDYKKGQIVEEGHYVDNKRHGIWTKFYPSGKIKSEITYKNNLPRGPYKVYYLNGVLEEEGDWQANKNIGDFKRFHENGKLAQEFFFTSNGKRDGMQKYFYENGEIQMSIEVDLGVAHGLLQTYYPTGEPKEEKRIVNGEVEEGSTKKYPSHKEISNMPEMPDVPRQETIPDKSDKPNLEEFKQTGFNTLYNKNKQITQVGEFKEGRLYNGKWHRYDVNGLLKKVEVYKGGKFIGFGVIEDTDK